MRKIFKYLLDFNTEQYVEMPADHKVLAVHEQNGKIAVWAEVDFYGSPMQQRFYVVETGGRVPFSAAYRGTAVLLGGKLVLHVYEDAY